MTERLSNQGTYPVGTISGPMRSKYGASQSDGATGARAWLRPMLAVALGLIGIGRRVNSRTHKRRRMMKIAPQGAGKTEGHRRRTPPASQGPRPVSQGPQDEASHREGSPAGSGSGAGDGERSGSGSSRIGRRRGSAGALRGCDGRQLRHDLAVHADPAWCTVRPWCNRVGWSGRRSERDRAWRGRTG